MITLSPQQTPRYKFEEYEFVAPEHDFDVTIVFPSGKKVTIQARPSNADVNYNGSLDIILPKNQAVTNWSGDDMLPAKAVSKKSPEIRIAKQLVTDLP